MRFPDPEIRPGIKRLFQLAARREQRVRDEADDEIRLHLRLRTDQLVREGWTPDAARAEAERRFGPMAEAREGVQKSARRREERMRIREWIDTVKQDLRYSVRTLRREPGFTAFAILIVGLGIGATATVFSVVNAVLLRPLPFSDPARLVWISNIGDDGVAEWRTQVSHFLDLRTRAQSLSGLEGYYAYYNVGDSKLSWDGKTERLSNVPLSCDFLPFLGVRPIVGRSFTPDECTFNGPRTVLLGHSLWRTRFASDPNVVGRRIMINDEPTTVIGVLPASFDFATVFAPGSKIDLFSAFPLTEENNRRGNTLAVVGRLKPGVTIENARAELVALAKQLMSENPRRNTLRPKVLAFDERINGRFRPALFVLACAVAVVMLIVSANLSSLQFARLSSRQKELAVRVALGAGRGRLIRQTLTESLVLSLGGAVLGLGLTVAGTTVVSRLRAFDIPLLDRVGIDATAFGFAVVVAVVTGLLIGLLPAIQTPASVYDALKDTNRGSTRGAGHTRVRGGLVVAEVALACMLLVGAGLLIRSFLHVLDVDLGYRPERTAALRIDPGSRFPDQPSMNSYYNDVLGRVRPIPGIGGAALADVLPFDGDRSWGVAGQGQMYEKGHYPEAFIRIVSDGYFATMGIPVRSGRDFTQSDVPTSERVVVMNETLARKLWPDRSAVDQFVMQRGQPWRVVGVVGDVRHSALEHGFTGELYFSMRQMTDYSAVNLVVRTDLSQTQLASSVRSAMQPLAPDLPRAEWRTLQQLVDKVASPRRFVVLLLSGFAAFALVLAALGIYALVSYSVGQRTHEIGIRMALGATARDLRARIMSRTLALAGVGIVLGVAASALLVRTLSGLLFGVTSTDPVTFVGAFAVLSAVAALAGYLPARRASRIDPSIALREG
jgi:predicted permease